MNFSMVILKINIVRNRNYYSHIQTDWCIWLKLKIFITIPVIIKLCLILVNVVLGYNLMMIQIHKCLVKQKVK